MLPARISIVTYNIWLTQRWAVRAPALRGFLESFSPDILCLQELQAQSRDFIDQTLPDHKRIDDLYSGWTTESNIYWRDTRFTRIEHGTEDVGIPDGVRRLVDLRRVRDVAHGDRRTDDALAGDDRRQLVSGHDADDAEFVERIRNRAGEIDERLEAVDDVRGQARQFEQPYRVARQFAESFLVSHGINNRGWGRASIVGVRSTLRQFAAFAIVRGLHHT